MAVRTEKQGPVWTIVHSRPEVRNAVDPAHSLALFEAFVEFERDDDDSSIGDLSFDRSTDDGHVRGPMGPSRLNLSKPVIAAVAGPAVAGGMELALWADVRVMEESAYIGVYCRRWGVPLIDGGTIRLPRLVGQGRALDLILTGRQVMAEECERIGLCEYVVADGESRSRAEELARDIARFPQQCVRSDLASAKSAFDASVEDGLRAEFARSAAMVRAEGIEGARRFAGGAGRGGDFGSI